MEELIIQEYLDGNSISKLLQKYPQYNRRAINKLFADNNIAIRGGRKKKTEKPYWMLSIEKIEQLKTRTAAHELSLERAVARLTDIVRQYLEQRFLLPAAHLTTEEFMKNLEADGKSPLREQDRKFLKSFLNAADYVKFAGVSAEASMFQNAADKAEQLIRESSEGTAFNENEGQENAVRNGGGGMKNGI